MATFTKKELFNTHLTLVVTVENRLCKLMIVLSQVRNLTLKLNFVAQRTATISSLVGLRWRYSQKLLQEVRLSWLVDWEADDA